MYDLWPPGPLCPGSGSASHALRPSGKTAGGAQLATQHRARDGRFARHGGQTGKKKRTQRVRRCPAYAQSREWEALELDKMWTFVGSRKRKVWLWLAIERASRHIVAWVTGRCDAATAGRLWQALPGRYRRHCWYFTDLFPAYVGVLPRWQQSTAPCASAAAC